MNRASFEVHPLGSVRERGGQPLVVLTLPGRDAVVMNAEGRLEVASLLGVSWKHPLGSVELTEAQATALQALAEASTSLQQRAVQGTP